MIDEFVPVALKVAWGTEYEKLFFLKIKFLFVIVI
jgi:hypothetical protein